MRFVNRTILAAGVLAVLCFTRAPLFAEDRAGGDRRPPLGERPSCKTPHGVGLYVQPDDPVLIAGSAAGPAAPLKPDPALVRQLVRLAEESLAELSEKSSPADSQYYEKGRWYYGDPATPGAWLYQAGPAGMAAALWKYRQDHAETMDAAARAKQEWLRRVAVETFERALKEHQKPDGDFLDLAQSHREFFTIDFVNTYLLLKDSLEAEVRARWLDAMRRQVEFMCLKGGYPNPALIGKPGAAWKGSDGWYINGNVELAKAEFIYLVWLATGEPKYKDLFELQWKHTLRPNWERWGKMGYGLFYFSEPTKADGSDGRAFIAEANAVPGFDKEYGLLQASIAARLYVKSHDPRVLRLTNLLMNVLLPYLDRKTMLVDATYGSRKSSLLPLSICTPAVLAWNGGRSEMLPLLPEQFERAVQPSYLNNARLNQCNYGLFRGYGFDLAALLEAADAAQGKP